MNRMNVKKIIAAVFAAETSDPRVRAASIALVSLIVNVAVAVLRSQGVA